LLRKRTQGVTKSGHFLKTLRPQEWGRGTQECVRHNRYSSSSSSPVLAALAAAMILSA
jgi:hypothetical protein